MDYFRDRELRKSSWVKMMAETDEVDPAARTDLLRTSIEESYELKLF